MAKKRKYGSGTVRKRSDGRWEARVVIGYDESSNPKTKNVLAKTKAECLVKLEELKEKYAPPVTRCKPDMPFGDWMDFGIKTTASLSFGSTRSSVTRIGSTSTSSRRSERFR